MMKGERDRDLRRNNNKVEEKFEMSCAIVFGQRARERKKKGL
jgi:hypothetical protein